LLVLAQSPVAAGKSEHHVGIAMQIQVADVQQLDAGGLQVSGAWWRNIRSCIDRYSPKSWHIQFHVLEEPGLRP